MTRIAELAQVAAERRRQFENTLDEIKSRRAIPAFAIVSLALAALLGAGSLTTAVVARLAFRK